jgi:hypothetical protein
LFTGAFFISYNSVLPEAILPQDFSLGLADYKPIEQSDCSRREKAGGENAVVKSSALPF